MISSPPLHLCFTAPPDALPMEKCNSPLEEVGWQLHPGDDSEMRLHKDIQRNAYCALGVER